MMFGRGSRHRGWREPGTVRFAVAVIAVHPTQSGKNLRPRSTRGRCSFGSIDDGAYRQTIVPFGMRVAGWPFVLTQ